MASELEGLISSDIPESGSISWSEPVISGKHVIFGSCDRHLYCIDLKTGKLLWKFLTGGAVFSGANAVRGKIYFSSADKHLYCLTQEGRLVWKKIFPGWPIGITAVEDRLYISCLDGNLYAISLDGETIWKFSTGGMLVGYPAVINGNVYFGSFDKNFYCLDDEGGMKWEFLTGGRIEWAVGISGKKQIWSVTGRNGTKKAGEGAIFFGSYDNHLYSLDLEGNFRWKFLTGGKVATPPSFREGMVYFGSYDKNFYCIDENGRMKWRFVAGGFLDTPACIVSEAAYFGCHDGSLYAVELDGRAAWKFQTGGPVLSPPVHHKGVIIFGSSDSFVYAVRIRDRKILWKFQTGLPAAPFLDFLRRFTEAVETEQKPQTFLQWKPETLKNSYERGAELGNFVTSGYKSDNPYMNKPLYRMKSPYEKK